MDADEVVERARDYVTAGITKFILRPLGEGSFGAVYEARHVEDRSRKGAIKLLLSAEKPPKRVRDHHLRQFGV